MYVSITTRLRNSSLDREEASDVGIVLPHVGTWYNVTICYVIRGAHIPETDGMTIPGSYLTVYDMLQLRAAIWQPFRVGNLNTAGSTWSPIVS